MRDGEQHKDSGNGATINPYTLQPVNPYTAIEIAKLQARLDQQLGPEFIATRPGGGGNGKVSYIEAFKVIQLANDIFGFNGWSSSVQSVTVDFVDEKSEGRYNIGLTVVMRVTLKDGTYHEDIGYGSIENCKGKAAAYEKCKKEGTTDAMKRALRNFGNVLGNCLYDKQFLKEVGKMKVPSTKFDPELLHRRPEFALPADHPKSLKVPVAIHGARRASINEATHIRTEDSYGDDIFDGLEFEEDRVDNYDHVLVDTTIDNLDGVTPNPASVQHNANYHPPNEFTKTPSIRPVTQEEAKRLNAQRAKEREALANRPPPPPFCAPVPTEPVHPDIVASEAPADYQPSFMTSRSLVEPNAQPALFDPKIQSPNLQRSSIDHSKSTPIKRPGVSNESPVPIKSPLGRMAAQLNPGMATRSNQFRAPSKLNPGVSGKRGSEALAEHPVGSISMNERVVSGSSDGSTEKRTRV